MRNRGKQFSVTKSSPCDRVLLLREFCLCLTGDVRGHKTELYRIVDCCHSTEKITGNSPFSFRFEKKLLYTSGYADLL